MKSILMLFIIAILSSCSLNKLIDQEQPENNEITLKKKQTIRTNKAYVLPWTYEALKRENVKFNYIGPLDPTREYTGWQISYEINTTKFVERYVYIGETKDHHVHMRKIEHSCDFLTPTKGMWEISIDGKQYITLYAQ